MYIDEILIMSNVKQVSFFLYIRKYQSIRLSFAKLSKRFKFYLLMILFYRLSIYI